MAFNPIYSTNEIYRRDEMDKPLEDDLVALETGLAGKAPTNHEHTGYSESGHTHTQESITGLIQALADKAAATHNHELSAIVGLIAALAAKADLVDGVVPASQLPSYVDDAVEYDNLAAFPATGESGKIYVAKDTNKTYRWSGTTYVEIAGGVALGETASTAHRGDHGKVAYDHSQTGDVHVTTAQKTAWDSKAAGNHIHNATVVTVAGEDLNNYTTPGTWTFPQAFAPTNVPAGTNGWLIVLPWGDDGGTIKQIWLRHGTINETDHEVYTRTRIGDVGEWGSWSRFCTTKDKIMNIMNEEGDVSVNLTGTDITATIAGLAAGMYTGYSPVGNADTTNAPNTNEAWRYMIHKTGINYGWVLAFGSYGSVYANYINAGTWRGWKNLVDGTSAPLWKHESDGGYYMIASQTVTPSKALNQCRNGWVLEWSDYDPSTGTTNNADICTTVIPKRNPTGALWGGQGFLCLVPTYMNDADDTDNIHIKKVYVHNDKLVGFAGNNLGDRRDSVLRAVYEY